MAILSGVDELLRTIKRFDPEPALEEAKTPPAVWYTDPRVFELERETVFRSSWQFVGRTDQVRESGDFFSGDLMGRPFLVTRDRKGELRAFYNVCSHHGSRLTEGQGRCKELVCPYHGWTYALSGKLVKAPRAGAVKALSGRGLDLKPLPVKTWGPFVLVHFGNAGSFEADIDGLTDLFPSKLFDGLAFVGQKVYEIEANWKVFVDNYLDGGYHVAQMHPDLAEGLHLSTYRSEVAERWTLQSCRSSSEKGRVGELVFYAWLYPNFMINRYGKWMDTNWVLPLGVDRCMVVFDYFYEGACPAEIKGSAMAASLQVQLEDMEICKMVRAGLHSGAYDQGVYAPRYEAPMYQFHRLLSRDYQAWPGFSTTQPPD